ncbi:uncharacterized, partial [Tachysurus ichikawai]
AGRLLWILEAEESELPGSLLKGTSKILLNVRHHVTMETQGHAG